MYWFFFKFFSYLGCYRILNRDPYTYNRSLLIIYFNIAVNPTHLLEMGAGGMGDGVSMMSLEISIIIYVFV